MTPDFQTLTISLTPFIEGVSRPVFVTHAGDDSDRLFVVEQGGAVRIIENGELLDTPFIDVSDRISTGSERGLLSMAFSPDYATNGEFYLNYTNDDGDTVVARYQVRSNPNRGNVASEEVILTVNQEFSNHNGGQLAFGDDGYLYIGMGDGGSGGDPNNRAQTPDTLLGKMLRIDVESQPSANTNYRVPADNPFLNDSDPSDRIPDEIWAFGLRNPWRFSFDRATGDLYIADVGQNAREEVNFQPANSTGGENYGWSILEGSASFNQNRTIQFGTLTDPIAEYDHDVGRSITGGYVYRGETPSELTGTYLYGDFATGIIWGTKNINDRWQNTVLLDTTHQISTFGEDQEGNLYVADFADGVIYSIVPPALSAFPVEPPVSAPDNEPDPIIEPGVEPGVEPEPTEISEDGTNDQPPDSLDNSETSTLLTPSPLNLRGTAVSDRVQGADTDDRLRGLGGDDIVRGGKGADRLFGDGGNDTVRGGRGNDRVSGGTGQDRLWGGNGQDRLRGGSGADVLNGGNGRDRLLGGPGNDRLMGGKGADTLLGGKGNDQLLGGDGPDQLQGGPGQDRLVGANGRDDLSGGGGRDRFVLQIGKGSDRIQDFQLTQDQFELPASLTFDDLIVQPKASDTTIGVQTTAGNEILATVMNIQPEQLTSGLFQS